MYKLSGKDRNLVLPCMQAFMGYDFTFEPLKIIAVLHAGNLASFVVQSQIFSTQNSKLKKSKSYNIDLDKLSVTFPRALDSDRARKELVHETFAEDLHS